jgi:hypothetical protein
MNVVCGSDPVVPHERAIAQRIKVKAVRELGSEFLAKRYRRPRILMKFF